MPPSPPASRITVDRASDVPDWLPDPVATGVASLAESMDADELTAEQLGHQSWVVTARFDGSDLTPRERGDVYQLIEALVPDPDTTRLADTRTGEFVVRLDYSIGGGS